MKNIELLLFQRTAVMDLIEEGLALHKVSRKVWVCTEREREEALVLSICSCSLVHKRERERQERCRWETTFQFSFFIWNQNGIQQSQALSIFISLLNFNKDTYHYHNDFFFLSSFLLRRLFFFFFVYNYQKKETSVQIQKTCGLLNYPSFLIILLPKTPTLHVVLSQKKKKIPHSHAVSSEPTILSPFTLKKKKNKKKKTPTLFFFLFIIIILI